MTVTPEGDPGRPRLLVIGVGQRFRRDDGLGCRVAATVRAHAAGTVDVVSCAGDACDLVSLWDGRTDVIVVDAMVSGAAPATLAEFEIAADGGGDDAEAGGFSTHAHGVMAAVGLARALGRLPARLRILAIEAADTGWGDGLTPAVEAAASIAARRILDESRHGGGFLMPGGPAAG